MDNKHIYFLRQDQNIWLIFVFIKYGGLDDPLSIFELPVISLFMNLYLTDILIIKKCIYDGIHLNTFLRLITQKWRQNEVSDLWLGILLSDKIDTVKIKVFKYKQFNKY